MNMQQAAAGPIVAHEAIVVGCGPIHRAAVPCG